VVHKNNTRAVYDQAGEVVVPAQFFAEAITNQLWSPNSDALLVTTGNPPAVWHVPLTQRAIPAPVAVSLDGGSGVVWDPRIPGRLLYVDAAGMLQAYTLQSGIQVALIPQASLFATSASYIYVADEAERTLVEYTLQGQPTGTAFPLPEGQTGAVSQLLVTPQKNIAIRFATGEVWVLNSDDRFEHVGSGIATVAWSPAGNVLLLTTDTSSLYVYNVDDKRTPLPLRELRLVQRLSRPIIDPRWFAGGRHVVYQVDDAVWITEIDTRDHPISFEVDTTNTGSAEVAVGEEGETIFYLKNTATDTTLVAAPLLVP
jgi:DNA-binding beta-propeller fold protein YncE